MTKHMQVGVKIARQIRTAEHAVDHAMIEVCKLIQTSLEGRFEARLAAEVGQAALEDIVAGLNQLTKVRASVASGHAGLLEVAETKQIGWRLDGSLEDKSGNPVAPVLSVAA